MAMPAERSHASEKSPDAFRTISEVADDLDVPQHVLRFWETRFGQIRPLKRGGGRRYYRPDDVDLLRGIKHLLYGEGYTIKGVQRILKSQGLKFVQGVWRDPASLALAEAARQAGVAAEFAEEEDELADEPAPVPIPAPGPAAAPLVGLVRAPSHRGEEELPARLALRPPADEPATAAPCLSPEAIQRLRAMLVELVEAKRLLDQSR